MGGTTQNMLTWRVFVDTVVIMLTCLIECMPACMIKLVINVLLLIELTFLIIYRSTICLAAHIIQVFLHYVIYSVYTTNITKGIRL